MAAPRSPEPLNPPRLRLAYVPGATPGKWARVWQERYDVPLDLLQVPAASAEAALRGGEADVAILRLPVNRDGLAVIPLYQERSVVVVACDHLFAALDDAEGVTLAQLADEVLLHPLDGVFRAEPAPAPDVDNAGAQRAGFPEQIPAKCAPAWLATGVPTPDRPATTAEAVRWVAAGLGVLVVPQSLARLHHRRDVTYRFLVDGPTAPVALAWVVDRAQGRVGDMIEDFVGVVRGRTARSSRGRSGAASGSPPDPVGDPVRGSGRSAAAGAKRAAGSAARRRRDRRRG